MWRRVMNENMSEQLAVSIATEVVNGLSTLLKNTDVEFNHLQAEDVMNIVLENTTISDTDVLFVEQFLSSELYQKYEQEMSTVIGKITEALIEDEDTGNI